MISFINGFRLPHAEGESKKHSRLRLWEFVYPETGVQAANRDKKADVFEPLWNPFFKWPFHEKYGARAQKKGIFPFQKAPR